jgi:hypothetical protein
MAASFEAVVVSSQATELFAMDGGFMAVLVQADLFAIKTR